MTIKDTMMPVLSSYHGATTFGQTSPGHASRPFQQSASPGPTGQELYNQSPEQSYVQATSPQPSGFQALAINRVRLAVWKSKPAKLSQLLGTNDTCGIYKWLSLKEDKSSRPRKVMIQVVTV